MIRYKEITKIYNKFASVRVLLSGIGLLKVFKQAIKDYDGGAKEIHRVYLADDLLPITLIYDRISGNISVSYQYTKSIEYEDQTIELFLVNYPKYRMKKDNKDNIILRSSKR